MRERERETDRQTDRQTDKQREREGENERGRTRNTIKKLFDTEVRKPQNYRNIITEEWFKKNGRPVIGIDRACTLTRVHTRTRLKIAWR